MRIALSGSGGTGKTCTALEIASLMKYRYIQSQARIVFERNNTVSIERNLDQDPLTYVKVQVEIIENQIECENNASAVDHNWIAERTVLDSAAYFVYWSSVLPRFGGKWKRKQKLLENESLRMMNRCMMHITTHPYDQVIMMPFGRLPLVLDCYRSDSIVYQQAIDGIIRGLVYHKLNHVTTTLPEDVGDELATANWIIDECGIVPKSKDSGITHESNFILKTVSEQLPECIIMDRVCNILPNGVCTTCGVEVKPCQQSKSEISD